jgi:hypothetical protein
MQTFGWAEACGIVGRRVDQPGHLPAPGRERPAPELANDEAVNVVQCSVSRRFEHRVGMSLFVLDRHAEPLVCVDDWTDPLSDVSRQRP